MAARVPGAPSLAETARMRANAETGVTSMTNRYQWQLPLDSPGASNEFPIVPVPKDPYDDKANIKSQFAVQPSDPAFDNRWMVPFTDADAAYLERKRDAQEKAQFDAWVMQKYDITNPAENLMLQNIAPELFQRREEVIDQHQALVSAYAKTRLRGAKSLSDLELEWLIETGRVTLPEGPIWNPKIWRSIQTDAFRDPGNAQKIDEQWNTHRYRYGLFAPIKWLTENTAGKKPNPANRADIAGSNVPYTPGTVPYPTAKWANQWTAPIPYPYAGSNTRTRADFTPQTPYDTQTRRGNIDSTARRPPPAEIAL